MNAITTSMAPSGTTRGSARMPLRPLRASQANIASNPRHGSPLARVVTTRSSAQLEGQARENRTAGEEDSSDDESNVAPVLSAAAEELLGGKQSQEARPPNSSAQRQSNAMNYAEYAVGSPVGRDNAAGRGPHQSRRNASPEQQLGSGLRSKSPRIVRVGSANKNGSPAVAMLRRTKSTGSANGSPVQRETKDYKTPAPAPRLRGYISNEDGSPMGSGQQASGEARNAYYSSGKSSAYPSSGGADVREGLQQQGTVTRDHGMHSSLRIKRLGSQGTFLRGPARRGMIRRQSEEEQSPLQRNSADYGELYGQAEKAEEGEEEESPIEEQAPSKVRFAGSQMPSLADDIHQVPLSTKRSPERGRMNPPPPPPPAALELNSHRRAQSASQAPSAAEIVAQLPSQYDKENEPPSSQQQQQRIPTAAEVFADLPLKPVIHSAVKVQDRVSPQRAPLGAKSTNTPLRPAPPPPKMNVVDTATAAAGAMASQKRKKQATASMTVNGRRYTRLDCIGRGGSGKVFRVMAENYKLYALKRVSLEGMDELAIRGFKGEINLLQKLKDVDRVVRLIDYEVNDERQTLTVLMEMGELDLKKLLDPRLDEQTGKFDVTFTRHIWREMLECVQSVHDFDVVHSDLKPANFVMVQGKLKLIDFGIANAIADDTVNVHREQQIGTPNYMAPEALVDTNAHERGISGGAASKLMKLGKPSDVWSLGCILYQIVYGKSPFAQIAATHSKAMAIVSERHQINFPDHGLGGVPVPLGLLRTMKRCLQRDQKLRPSIPELLGERDPFLHPDAPGLIPLNEELLGMIQRKLVSVIKQRGNVPDDGELALWQSNMFENVRNAIKEGKVQV